MQECRETDCELETDATAKARQKSPATNIKHKRAADLDKGDKVIMHDNTVRTVKDVHPGFGLILKGSDNYGRPVMINWSEGDFSMVERTQECMVVDE